MKQELIKKSIAHWERMYKWVEKQKPDDIICAYKMVDAIGECWSGKHCPLCLEYFRFNTEDNGDCTRCPLFKAGHGCEAGPWIDVNCAFTWGEWLEAAQKMIKTLEELK